MENNYRTIEQQVAAIRTGNFSLGPLTSDAVRAVAEIRLEVLQQIGDAGIENDDEGARAHTKAEIAFWKDAFSNADAIAVKSAGSTPSEQPAAAPPNEAARASSAATQAPGNERAPVSSDQPSPPSRTQAPPAASIETKAAGPLFKQFLDIQDKERRGEASPGDASIFFSKNKDAIHRERQLQHPGVSVFKGPGGHEMLIRK